LQFVLQTPYTHQSARTTVPASPVPSASGLTPTPPAGRSPPGSTTIYARRWVSSRLACGHPTANVSGTRLL